MVQLSRHYLQSKQGSAVELVVASLEVEAGPLAALLACDERQRAARFTFDRDRRRFTVARARLRQLLGERLGVLPESVELTYAPRGKPALAPRHACDLRFNLSHCEELAVYAFADGCEVGVDVEALRALDEADAIAAQCFAPGEHGAYRAFGFFYCWTRKEAYLKALGIGLEHRLQGFDASLAPPGWRLQSFAPAPGFVAALAVAEREHAS